MTVLADNDVIVHGYPTVGDLDAATVLNRV
jgi:hypothetical protein